MRHLRPAPAPARAIRFTRTFGLGGMAMVPVLLLMASGLWTSFIYDAAPERAHRSIVVLQPDLLLREVEIEDGHVLVDTTRRIRRAAFEPEQVARVGSNA